VSSDNPFSSTKNTCKPLPRSSVPRKPMRDGSSPVSEFIFVTACPAASTFVRYDRLVSTTP